MAADLSYLEATLLEALDLLSVDALKERVALLPVTSKPKRKAELVAAIDRALTENTLRQLWERLDQTQQHAVREALHSPDGSLSVHQFQAKYGATPRRTYDTSRYPNKPTPLALFLHGDKYHHDLPSFIPVDLRERLRPFVPAPKEVTMAAVDELPDTVAQPERGYSPEDEKRPVDHLPLLRRDLEHAAQQDLLAVLRLIDAGNVAISAKTRRGAAAAVRRIGEVLADGDFFAPEPPRTGPEEQSIGPIRAYAWPLLVQAGKLAELHGTRLALTKAGRAALSQPPADTVRRLWQRWLDTTLLDEFSRIDTIKGQRGRGRRGMSAARDRRPVIEEALAECPVNRWVQYDEFSRYMQAAGLDFSVTHNPWSLYLFEPRYDSLGYAGQHGWDTLQDRYILCLLFEYAATLGMIDVAYTHPRGARLDPSGGELEFLSRYDGLRYFRLTPLGAYCLELAESYVPSTPAASVSLSVFPDLRVQVTEGTLTPDEALLLETYATREADGVWRLDHARTVAAVENGHRVEELDQFLSARDDQSLPERVEGFLRTSEQRARALTPQGSALLFACADPAVAEQLASDPRTAKLCVRAGERLLVVPTQSENAFRKAVHELGYGMGGARRVAAQGKGSR